MKSNIKNKHVCLRVNKEESNRLKIVMEQIGTTNKSQTLRHLVNLWFDYERGLIK
jgi:hypothetical protein